MQINQGLKQVKSLDNLAWWIIGAVTLLLLPFLLYKSQAVDYQQYSQIISDVAEVRELDTRVNKTLLLVNQNPRMSYDRLARNSNDLYEASHNLWRTNMPGITEMLREQRLEFERSLEMKLDLIEHYKSHHAVMKNSSSYFSFIAQKAIDDHQTPDVIARTINDILHAIHRFRIDHSNVHLETVKSLRDKLQQELKAVNMDGDPRFEVMHIHTGLIFRYALEISDQIAQILSINLLHQLTEIEQQYTEYHRQQQHTASLYRFALFAVALLLAVVVVVTLSRQRRSVRDLNDALNELEFQKHALDEHAIVSITDVKGDIIYANQKFCDISGYSLEELKGKNHRLVKSAEHPPDFFRDMWRTIASGSVWHGEIHNISRSGQDYWVRSTIVPFLNEQGKPFRYVSIRTDITDRKVMEQEVDHSHKFLTGITENIGECVYVLDNEGHCTFLNKEAENQLGWSKDELLGRNIHDAIHFQRQDGSYMPQAECPAHMSITEGKKYQSEDEFFTRKDGSLFPVSVISVPMIEGDIAMGSVTVFQDITQRRNAEQELLQAKESAEHTSRLKSEFLANMSHEIRTPMNGMLGTIELLRETPLNDTQYEYVEAAHRSSEHLLTLINDILDLSKLESGIIEVERVDFDITEALEDLADLYAANAKGKGLQLNWGMSADMPEWVKGDRVRLWQVLTNLTGNAIKFTEQGSVSVTAALEKADSENMIVRFEVKDTGIGIQKEAQGRIFNAFEQADGSMTRRFGGTGLGLSLSKRLVELMGGEIGIESEPGNGSTFWFTAKLNRSHVAKQPQSDVLLAQKRVLIVDDVGINRLILERFTSQWEMSPYSVSSSDEALQELEHAAERGENYDLVLIDHNMEGMDGLMLATHIRQQQRFNSSKLVLHSSDAEKLTKQQERVNYLDAVLRKPLRRRTLHNQLLRIYGANQTRHNSVDKQVHKKWINAKILLVDDNDVNRMIVRGMLEKLGITDIETAENGQQALEQVKSKQYDLVLMDVQMPVMNGHEATRAIRQHEADDRHTTIVALTAHAFTEDVEKCMQVGMDDYLSKPLQQNALLTMLSRWVAGDEPANSESTGAVSLETTTDDETEAAVLDEAVITMLREVLGDDGIKLTIESFLKDAPNQIANIKKGHDEGDWQLMTRAAHTLKGSSGSLGANHLVELALYIEKQGRKERGDGIVAVLEELQSHFNVVKLALTELTA